jgi:hypothetical protein
MVDEKHEYYLNREDKIMEIHHFVENKTEVMQHGLKT